MLHARFHFHFHEGSAQVSTPSNGLSSLTVALGNTTLGVAHTRHN
jgi:hypothetical protein